MVLRMNKFAFISVRLASLLMGVLMFISFSVHSAPAQEGVPTKEGFIQYLDTLINTDIQDSISRWGKPLYSDRLSESDNWKLTFIVPGKPYLLEGEEIQTSCLINLLVRPSGRVGSYSFEGNSCVASEKSGLITRQSVVEIEETSSWNKNSDRYHYLYSFTEVDGVKTTNRHMENPSFLEDSRLMRGRISPSGVPARPVRVKLVAMRKAYSRAEEETLKARGQLSYLEGVIDFRPVDGERYYVTGTMDSIHPEVWIAKAGTQERVTEKVTTENGKTIFKEYESPTRAYGNFTKVNFSDPDVSFSYDLDTWNFYDKKDRELMLRHKSKLAMGIVKVLPDVDVSRFENYEPQIEKIIIENSNGFKIKKFEKLKVKNTGVYVIELSGPENMTVLCRVIFNKSAAVMVGVGTVEKFFAEFNADFVDLLNGLSIDF